MFFISLVKQISCFYFRLIVKTTILYEVASKGCKPETSLYEVLQEFATGLELSSLVILDATSSMNRTEWYVQKREHIVAISSLEAGSATCEVNLYSEG